MNKKENREFTIGITIGDVNGVGPEVILKTFLDPAMMQGCTPIVFASSKVIGFYRKTLGLNDLNYQVIRWGDQPFPRKLNIMSVWEEETKIEPGISSPVCGQYAVKSLEAAMKAFGAGMIDALVTAPINKKNIQSEQFNFPGHTEFLTQQTGAEESLMLMVYEDLRIGVVTGHVPVKDISSKLTEELILKKCKLFNNALINDFGIRKPKIALLGLNPHAGDQGAIGKEEIEVIVPAIEKAKADHIMVMGPYSADGFFGSSLYEKFDGILAMYHDQGLVPFKTLAFGNGVNFTAGLPLIRTSPDHGTAYDIAGKNIANENSFRQAVYLATDIYKTRTFNTDLNSNTLKITKRQKERS